MLRVDSSGNRGRYDGRGELRYADGRRCASSAERPPIRRHRVSFPSPSPITLLRPKEQITAYPVCVCALRRAPAATALRHATARRRSRAAQLRRGVARGGVPRGGHLLVRLRRRLHGPLRRRPPGPRAPRAHDTQAPAHACTF